MSQERVRRYWDDQAARFDAMIAPVERRFLAAIREWAAGRARGAVLEVAVGTGLNLAYYGADARITAVEINRREARITVRYQADISAVTRDAEGTVIAGSMSDASQTDDLWTFRRQIGSSDPNWLLDEVEAA